MKALLTGLGLRFAMGAEPAPRWQPISALPLMATMVADMLDAAGQSYQRLGRAPPSWRTNAIN